MSLFVPYVSNAADQQARARNSLVGMDSKLRELVLRRPAEFSEVEETLVRQAAGHYEKQLLAVKQLVEQGQTTQAGQQAAAALVDVPEGTPELRGPHISLNMCVALAHYKFAELARIADAHQQGLADQDFLQRRMARAYPAMGWR